MKLSIKIALFTLAALLLVSCAPAPMPTPQAIPVKVVVTPADDVVPAPTDPSDSMFSYNINNYYQNCKDRPTWMDLSGVTYSTDMTDGAPDQATWSEGRFTRHFEIVNIQVQINDRVVKFPSLNTVQLIPYVKKGETYYNEVQELKPEEYQKRATELLGPDPSFDFDITFNWSKREYSGGEIDYYWAETCTTSE